MRDAWSAPDRNIDYTCTKASSNFFPTVSSSRTRDSKDPAGKRTQMEFPAGVIQEAEDTIGIVVDTGYKEVLELQRMPQLETSLNKS